MEAIVSLGEGRALPAEGIDRDATLASMEGACPAPPPPVTLAFSVPPIGVVPAAVSVRLEPGLRRLSVLAVDAFVAAMRGLGLDFDCQVTGMVIWYRTMDL